MNSCSFNGVFMNVKNNKRRQETVSKIESAFMDFLKTQEISQIKVTAICEKAGINRGTFYANFVDVYDLADKMHIRLKNEVNELFEQDIRSQYTNENYLKLFEHIFEHIKKNQTLYAFYFKLGYDDSDDLKLYDICQMNYTQNLSYHIAFFKSGFNTIVKKWINGGCKESPEEMRDILLLEYTGRFS